MGRRAVRCLGAWAVALALGVWPNALQAQQTSPFIESLRPLERVRLPDQFDALPVYELDLQLDPGAETFEVTQRLTYVHRRSEPMGALVLRMYANVTRPGALRVRAIECERACPSAQASGSRIVVRFERPLTEGERATVRLRLHGRLRHIDADQLGMLTQGLGAMAHLRGGGSQGSDYGLLAVGDGIFSFANFFAVIAPWRDGQWVQREANRLGDLTSDDLSNVQLRVRAPARYRVVASGTRLRRELEPPSKAAPAMATTTFACALTRDFSVLLSDRMRSLHARVGDVTVRSHFLRGHEAAGRRVLDVGQHALAFFQKRFGAYPYVDLDLVEAPLVGGAGGVEFSGLVTVASMFYRPLGFSEAGDTSGLLSQLKGLSNLGNLGDLEDLTGMARALGQQLGDASFGSLLQSHENMLEFVTAHEVAHQYWHGVVGSDSRAHPFVDESLAQYSALLYVEDRYGAERAEADADGQVAMNYRMMRMMGIPDGPVLRPVGKFRNAVQYAGLVYGKGALMYRALRAVVGDPAFFRGLREYVERYRYVTAPPMGPLPGWTHGPHGGRARKVVHRWLRQAHGDADLGVDGKGATPARSKGPGGAGGALPDLQGALRTLMEALGR